MEKQQIRFMKAALQCARNAGARGEVPVGTVIVVGDKIVARAGNRPIGRQDPSAHAEINALRRAARKLGNYRLPQADVYTTLEPCLMCYGALVQARIRNLYYGASDEKGGVFSTGFFAAGRKAFNHAVNSSGGLLAAQSGRLLSDFFALRRGAGAVERDGLENRCPFTGTVGSNPTPSDSI